MDANDSNAVARKCTWGLDLSGLSGKNGVDGIHSADGIGGLLAIEDVNAGGGSANSYWYFYDANGNVGQLIKASDRSLAAHYEYDPYGNTIAATGPYAAANPWRFSTKWHDAELSGNVLIYYGYRYYSPRLGRWTNWDPIEEKGGINLYTLVMNDPVSMTDPLGLCLCCLKIGYKHNGTCKNVKNAQGTCSGVISTPFGDFDVTLTLKDFNYTDCGKCDAKCLPFPIIILIPVDKQITHCKTIFGKEFCGDLNCHITGGTITYYTCCKKKGGEK